MPEKTFRVPWGARRSNQSILKEINPECSLEGLMLKLKLQYFGHLIPRADSLGKTLILAKTEGRRRRGQQRMMLMFTLAISYLTTSNLPRFMDLTLQVPMQCCSLQHLSLLPSPITSTAGHCFHFGSISSFFLSYFSTLLQLHIGHLDLGSSSFSVLSFYLFILLIGFSRQEYWSGLPFPSPADHILSELSIMTCPSWVALHSMAHSFIELDKAR